MNTAFFKGNSARIFAFMRFSLSVSLNIYRICFTVLLSDLFISHPFLICVQIGFVSKDTRAEEMCRGLKSSGILKNRCKSAPLFCCLSTLRKAFSPWAGLLDFRTSVGAESVVSVAVCRLLCGSFRLKEGRAWA